MINNLHLKLLSLFIAVMLWFGLVTGEYREVNIHAPIRLINIPNDYVAVAETKLINVVAKGPAATVKKIEYDDIEVVVDVSGMKTGDTVHHIEIKDVKTPPGIEVVQVKPAFIRVTVDQFIKKTLKINPVFIGDPADGYKVEGVSVYPDKVEVEGARSKLEQINSIETLHANLTGRKDSVNFSIGMKREEGVKNIKPAQVDVYVTFKEDIQKGEADNVKVVLRGLPEGFKAKPIGSVKISVEGRSDLLGPEMIRNGVKLYVDLSGIKNKGRYLREIKVESSDRYKVIDISSKKIRVEVTDAEILRN